MKFILRWLQSLSTAWIAILVLAGTSIFVAGSVTAYRTYDYIEHDNDFCMSCHLMAEPFERFGQSAHRDLGCKACHCLLYTSPSPRDRTRSRMPSSA